MAGFGIGDATSQMAQQWAQQASSGNMLATTNAQIQQENNSTQQQIMTIQQQMRAENQKAVAQRHQIQQETNNKLRDMANETYVNRVKSGDKHQKSVLDFIKG